MTKLSRDTITRLRRELLDWYDRSGRILPWRIRPDDRDVGRVADPYAVWLSEIMLQQTTVPHATPYWHRFLDRWPSVEALAAAPDDDVLTEWAGLGYYARARNLIACARQVAEQGGRFPDTLEGLKALPGIGDYTANAILAAAFDKPSSVVDGNVERVMTRVFRIETPLPKAKPEITEIAAEIADPDRPGDYAQAIMDLGATICTPRSPACGLCPWRPDCAAQSAGVQTDYPKKIAKKAKPVRRGIVWRIERDGKVWLRKRPETGLLGGMMEVPGSVWSTETPEADPPLEADWDALPEVRHVFTHFALTLEVRRADAPDGWEPGEGVWADLDALGRYALPSVFRKVLVL
ncbi:A/G-specific adenine glycosylase [Hyphobacterium sp. SN044]|uniref:A/G-specific adenine glycosylase n=1 Tax=Hyphobacterium sp. SN044 TaxID=2912575 RepID=UPI001F01571F|nr:A/G-specific adenine glycosylase [Hyphobacterium sp. SN044]MCF8880795.1 A/G-specific adenine glycosylase [Hyphobacterium sp. SN044]